MQTSSRSRKARMTEASSINPQSGRSAARDILEKAKQIPDGVSLLISEQPVPVPVSGADEDRLMSLFTADKLCLAQSVTALIAELGDEVRKGEYYLELLVDELFKLPPYTTFTTRLFKILKDIQKKGLRFTDLPDSFRDAQNRFVEFAFSTGISPEYLLGNLDKALCLLQRLGVRNTTLNVSALYHNYLSGFYELKQTPKKRQTAGALLRRAKDLSEHGVTVEIFKKGDFNRKVSALSPEDFNEALEQNSENYQVSTVELKHFMSSLLAGEERRLAASPALSIRKILEYFKLPAHIEKSARIPAALDADEVIGWQNTPLGKALTALDAGMDWPSFCTGVNIAGDISSIQKDKATIEAVSNLKHLANGRTVVLRSAREALPGEYPLSDTEDTALFFDLYCQAALTKAPFERVLDAAVEILSFIRQLENADPVIHLQDLLGRRLAGETLSSIFLENGLFIPHSPFHDVLRKLKNLTGKVDFFITDSARQVLLKDADVNAFRNFVVGLAARQGAGRSPEAVLFTLQNKVLPEITKLPSKVIGRHVHDLGTVTALSLSGIPARYPLRRNWKHIHLDRLAFMGCGLEPGVRNCQGCPVNNLYERVLQTSLALGYDEIITYEATGCFEVYTGIWPYTGKKLPSFHGVFGGAASEMLGGLAAKKARLKYALKSGKHLSGAQKILHLGWGGDGATFDIGFGNLSGLYSRLQKFSEEEERTGLKQSALYVCYDNEGYQNTGNQFSAATPPGSNTTTYPSGAARPIAGEFRKKPVVEIFAGHGIPFSARMNIHRVEHISRCVARALEDGAQGAFLHFLQPCTTGWKMLSDDITYELAFIAEEGGIFTPLTIEHGVPYLEVYPTPRNPEQAFLDMQSRFKHLQGENAKLKDGIKKVLEYYRGEWLRNLNLAGFECEIPGADSLGYIESEHRQLGTKA